MNQWMRIRISLIYFCFFFFFSLVVFRLVQLQVFPNEALSKLSKKQFTKTNRKAPFRIPILDRNHQELAVSIPVSSIFAHPHQVKSKKKTVRILTRELGRSTPYWLNKLDPKKSFVWLQRQINEEKALKIKNLNLPGIGIDSENKRVYPNGNLASHVLGFTDIDGRGLSGVEHSLNDLILEEKKRHRTPKDGRGNTSYIEKTRVLKSNSSVGIVLTLDRRIQSMVESELERALKETKAQAAMAVVMDPKNGEVLALAQRPSFNPNQPSLTSEASHRNRLIHSLYEPGSTLKVLFAAEAIEKDILKSDSILDCGGGSIRVGKTLISESDKKHRFDQLPLRKVITYSSNVGAVRIAQKIGVKGTKELLHRFGLLQKTGIELPAEALGQEKATSEITPLVLANMGFGQGISMTPIQLVTAFSPFANGGFLVSPTLLLDDSTSHHQTGERVISEETAETIRNLLVDVTEDPKGTGNNAKVPGVQVAGKTGTAQKFDSEKGYKSNKYFSSFVGFLPAKDPQLLIGVMIDEPKTHYYASQIASPLFRAIAEQSMHILNRGPAQALLRTFKQSDNRKKETLKMIETTSGKWKLPDLKGLSLQEAMNLLNKYLDKVAVSGNGYVISQSPPPGTLVDRASDLKIELGSVEN